MHFTEDQIAFRDTLRRFIDKEVVPIADEVDHTRSALRLVFNELRAETAKSGDLRLELV